MKLPLKLNNNNDVYYNCNKAKSYNPFMAKIDGGRGIGKTTSWLIDAIITVNKTGGEFIYMRRYKPEVKKFVAKNPLNIITEGITSKGFGTGGYIFYNEDTTIGYAIPLVTQLSYKSVDFSKVKLIIFDECEMKPGQGQRYLPNEVPDYFLEFISTVQRTRTDLLVVLLSNNADILSPYNEYFNIPLFEKVYYDKDRKLYCEHAINSPKLMEMEKKTGLYALTKGTAYADYHYDNKVLTSRKYPITTKDFDRKPIFRITINNQTLNVYEYKKNNEDYLYCEWRNKYIDDTTTYHLLEDSKLNYIDANIFRRKILNYLFRYYYDKKIYYNNEKAGTLLDWCIDNIK